MEMKEKIFIKLARFYRNEKEIEEWYEKPHGFLRENNVDFSPREIVERGEGIKVLEILAMVGL